ncbi:asparagine synthase (glutamine-hydrolyzing) [Granulicella aggregans]|uniref:asparagine synthase (glutamine-hydrolyzing) n=1 Tax=Granulicella aggregans TaxID=474949 RepID=A0A7W7ZIC5_9BACT|nr:asparagine synthase-related protein [Granulicella aggregans]MBB5060387.1 asparagine synthase (glutamine-hydrolyzing) [Granulicella aggregans]
MSILYGVLKEHGIAATASELQRLGADMQRYATGAGLVILDGRLGMGVQPYLSHMRSTFERGPVKSPQGRYVLSFDGRLDNYESLAEELRVKHPETLSDSQIALAAFARWGEACFSRFVGDWALALWSETDQSLYLSRDHAGARSLYYRHTQCETVWGTYLEAFHLTDDTLQLSHDYAACYMAGRQVGDLTPFEGIYSVPPAHFLKVHKGVLSRHQHWNSTVMTTVQYRTDTEYEEHFLALFRNSVERRSGPGEPILAQLSGGMDSTAIVCMSDFLRRRKYPNAEILDTVSFYDDSEASLNERPYFSITEARRGKVGAHVNTAFSQRTFEPHDGSGGVYLMPGADSFSIEQERRLHSAAWKRDYRSVLSGIGGDEVLGGVPDPLPELAGHLLSGNVSQLLRRSLAWSLVDRSPLVGMLWRTVRYTGGLYLNPGPKEIDLPPWLSQSLRERALRIESVKAMVPARIGIAPHRIDNSSAWWFVMETLPHLFPQLLVRPEYRYPFLDKDLVSFLFSVPREQILRPGRRRSLMRRALINIVPHEVLERRRKAFQLRAPLHAVQQASEVLEGLFANSMIADAGLVDGDKLRHSLRQTVEGDPKWWHLILRATAFELWLRSMRGGSGERAGDAGLRLIA